MNLTDFHAKYFAHELTKRSLVNFLNKTNASDQRVYQLLDEKFRGDARGARSDGRYTA